MSRKDWIILTVVAAIAATTVYILFRKLMSTFLQPIKGRISSTFGDRVHPITGAKSFHNGVDIAAPQGTPVKSPQDGEVITVDMVDDSAGGVQLRIKHANGWITGYAHLSMISVKPGEKVKRGQVVALVGNTGASTGAHLHLTLTDPKGNKVDPTQYFNKNLA